MASYDRWNHALLTYFVQGIARGAAIFLSVGDDVLFEVGRDLQSSATPESTDSMRQLSLPLDLDEHASQQLPFSLDFSRATPEEVVRDFCTAVRGYVALGQGRITLRRLRGRNPNGEPRGLAFLCAMVLAASRMGEDEEHSSKVYFGRLRDTLGLPPGDGRPDGMQSGAEAEEPLWQEWALWLQEQGYIPSARRGEGPSTYISYPISQALLRRADKDKLEKLFADHHWTASWDTDTLLTRVQREASSLTHHLQELLSSGEQRLRPVADAIDDLYTLWRENPYWDHAHKARTRNTTLHAGLYRVEDPFSGRFSYYLYPKQPRRREAVRVIVTYDGTARTLASDRPGWYEPLGIVALADLDQGAQYSIVQPPDLESLVFPERQFWVLVPDPEDAESGVYASWQPPTLGTHFILLCRETLLHQLEAMRNGKLIAWDGVPVQVAGYGGWIEIRDCMVVSENWSSVSIENRDLYEALRPRVSLNISLPGGLRVPGQFAWVDGHGPHITIIGFDLTADIRVINVSGEQTIFEESHSLNAPIPFDWPGPGTYRVEANSSSDSAAPRLVRIASWQELSMVQPERRDIIALGPVQICGALIGYDAPDRNEDNDAVVV